MLTVFHLISSIVEVLDINENNIRKSDANSSSTSTTVSKKSSVLELLYCILMFGYVGELSIMFVFQVKLCLVVKLR